MGVGGRVGFALGLAGAPRSLSAAGQPGAGRPMGTEWRTQALQRVTRQLEEDAPWRP